MPCLYLLPRIRNGITKTFGGGGSTKRYGFLSENASFAEACEKQGIAFVGPPSHAIESMGDKIASKKIASDAGVNIPGFKVWYRFNLSINPL